MDVIAFKVKNLEKDTNAANVYEWVGGQHQTPSNVNPQKNAVKKKIRKMFKKRKEKKKEPRSLIRED